MTTASATIELQARTRSQTVHGLTGAPIFHATRVDMYAGRRHTGTSFYLWSPIFRIFPPFTLEWERKGRKYTVTNRRT